MAESDKSVQYGRSEHHLPSGTVLAGRYRIEQVLGEGGFGITYVGYDQRLEIQVAVKEYFPAEQIERTSAQTLTVTPRPYTDAEEYAKGVQKFLSEARTMARMIKYPEIVGVRDYFEENGTAYIVMEYVEGITFQELVRQKGGRIPTEELLTLLRPLFGALSAVHEAGLLHRDISPDNLMLEDGRVRLLDFGCAREVPDGLEPVSLTISVKQGYGPIEQYQGHGQGPWTDVYGLSATIYYCLTGQTPPQAVDRVLEETLVPPIQMGADLSEKQQEALLRGLAVNPKKRCQSVQELYGGLYGVSWSEPQPDPKPKKFPVGLVIGAAVLAVAVILAVVFGVLWATGRNRPVSDTAEPDQTETVQTEPADQADQEDLTDQTDGTGQSDQTDSLAEPESVPVDTAWLEEAGVLTEGSEGEWNVQVCAANTEEELRALLEDDDVSAVVLPSGSYFGLREEDLIVTKPLRIEENAGIDCYEPITVSGDGLIWLEGQLSYSGSARVFDGGKIYVREGGILDWNSVLWLDREDGLVLSEGAHLKLNGTDYEGMEAASSVIGLYLLVLDLDDLFADAVHVTSYVEWKNLPDTAPAVVIDGDMAVDSLALDIPVIIRKGATVTVADEGQTATEGQILINYGTLKGSLTHPEDSGASQEEWLLINYGTMDVQLNCTGNGQLLNYGTLQFTGEIRSADFCNLGTMVCGASSDPYGAGNGAEELSVLLEGHLYNAGTWTLTQTDGGLTVWLNCMTINLGTVSVEANACLCNAYTLSNLGGIHLAQTGARLVNAGLLDCAYESSELVGADGSLWENGDSETSGIVTYNDHTLIALPEHDLEGFLYFEHDAENPGLRQVTTTESLREALSDESVRVLIVLEDLEYEEDLEVDGITLVVDEKQTLSVTGGHGIRVLNGGSLYIRGGTLDMEEGTLTLEDQAMLLACCPTEQCTYAELDVRSEDVRILYR